MRNAARRSRAARLGVVLLLALAAGRPPGVHAQVAPDRFFVDPVLILGGNGHHAPVRAMAFATANGSQLLTGGMDKVVHVWNLDADRSGPGRTLRPPNWRGYRGQINALALSPAVAGGDRLLAVAGYGVLADLGEILLFRSPDATGQGTGDVVGQLSASPAEGARPARPGHSDVVNALAFTPDGRTLASASNDKTVRIWDVAARGQVARLAESTGEVLSLAVFANGTRLITGGEDGFLRLYDITNPARPAFIAMNPAPGRPAPIPRESRIIAVAASPDNRWVVAATEGSRLTRFDAATLVGDASLKAPDDPLTGAILALAISPDGSRLATSTVRSRVGANPAAVPDVASFVEVRAMPDGRLLERLPAASNLVRALAFSPNSRRLAYSGGDAQAVYVKELAANAPAPDEIQGKGASLWDVGFRIDGRAIRFARSRPANPAQAADYEHFDLRARGFFNAVPAEPAYRHAVGSEAGWTIRTVDPYQLDFLDAQGRGWRVALNQAGERRWWAYTVVPPKPDSGHADPVAAVATDSGAVVLWNLRTGLKTRSFNGHAGPVYAVASSPDGKWLLTGSSDQTARLWPLAGSDRIPPFGARFERRAEGWVVVEVTPGGFADGIALKPGSVIESVEVGEFGPPTRFDPASVLPGLDTESPSKMITITARVPGQATLFRAATTKRDSPALTLFPGVDGRWALWTPRGYYDSSADGDRRFLGWLTNRGTVARLLAGTFDSIDKFEARYRQRNGPGNLLDRLLDTADPRQAAAAPAAPQAPDPTTSRLEALMITPAAPAPSDQPVAAAGATVLVDYRASAAAGAAPIRELWVEVDGRRLPSLVDPNAAPVPTTQGRLEVPLGQAREVRASLVAVDSLGVRRSERLDLSRQAPAPAAPRKARLVVVAIGAADFADKRLSRVEHADDDARDLARFFQNRVVDPATGVRFEADQVEVRPFVGPEVARSPILAAFDGLRDDARAGRVGPGDVLALVVESHFLSIRSRRLLVTAEPEADPAGPPALSASDLADRLGELTRLGCRAIVFVDAVHAVKAEGWDNDLGDWVRRLQAGAGVAAFIASDHAPSSPDGKGHRAFAQGVLDSLSASSLLRKRKPGAPFSLYEFERAVVTDVLEKTGRKQHAQLYLPDSLSYRVPILDPSNRKP